MPRLSLWRENHSGDYKFIDRRISEMFTVGGTGVLVHKYLGPATNSTAGDATKPVYQNQSVLNIQDLLFLENRDRKYDRDVYSMRGIYRRADHDFNLSQFGIFLNEGTLFITFHINDMVELLGRKLIAGDVIELMHLRDFHALDDSVPVALKRFYSITDTSNDSEGYSPTWWPHLWRCKLTPLVDSQEYKDILNNISASSSDPFAANTLAVGSVISTYNKYKEINEAVIAQAEINVPKSGYDTSRFYTEALNADGAPGSIGQNVSSNIDVSGGSSLYFLATETTVNNTLVYINDSSNVVIGSTYVSANTALSANVTVTAKPTTTTVRLTFPVTISIHEQLKFVNRPKNGNITAATGSQTSTGKIKGYLSGDGTAPNGMDVKMGVAFPVSPMSGDYFLRLDFVPNRLFRFDGKRWVAIEDAVRTNLTPGAPDNTTYRNRYVENTDVIHDINGNVVQSRQGLSKTLRSDI